MRIEIHGDTGGLRTDFEDALHAQCAVLKIDLDLVTEADLLDPAVTVVFADAHTTWTAIETARFSALAARHAHVLPVIDTAVNASSIPKEIKSYNAFQTTSWGAEWAAGLVDEVLSHAWLRRRERKIFVSYKRTDSAPLANHLYGALTRHQYLGFLDDVTIEKGVEFQRALKWWLNDADLLLVLLSPNFETSPWCVEEIAFAQSRSIGVLALEWPDEVYPPAMTTPFPQVHNGTLKPQALSATAPDQRLKLALSDFEASPHSLAERTLSAAGLEKVLAACARQRSKAIRQRLEDLVPLAKELLDVEGELEAADDFGDFRFTDKQSRTCFLRVLPFRPDATALHGAWQGAKDEAVGGCFYAECDRDDERVDAMRWLANRPSASTAGEPEVRLWACLGDEVLK